MCEQKTEALSKADKLIASMDQLSLAIHRMLEILARRNGSGPHAT